MSLLSVLSCILHKSQPQRLFKPTVFRVSRNTPGDFHGSQGSIMLPEGSPDHKGVTLPEVHKTICIVFICSLGIIVRELRWHSQSEQISGNTDISRRRALGVVLRCSSKGIGHRGCWQMPSKVFQMAGVGLVPPVPDPHGLFQRWKAGLQGEISAEEVRVWM